MIKLENGQTVYVVGEAWRYDDYIARVYYKVFKCKVDLVPRGGLREYRLASQSKPLQLFFRPRGQMYLTCTEALEVAKAEADKEDARNKLYGIKTRVYRPWERMENVRQTPSGQLQMAF